MFAGTKNSLSVLYRELSQHRFILFGLLLIVPIFSYALAATRFSLIIGVFLFLITILIGRQFVRQFFERKQRGRFSVLGWVFWLSLVLALPYEFEFSSAGDAVPVFLGITPFFIYAVITNCLAAYLVLPHFKGADEAILITYLGMAVVIEHLISRYASLELFVKGLAIESLPNFEWVGFAGILGMGTQVLLIFYGAGLCYRIGRQAEPPRKLKLFAAS